MRRRWASIAPLARRRVGIVVFAGYGVVAFLALGLPLFTEHGSRYVGDGTDPQIFIWSFGWWPHAILHGENPFFTHAVWAPDGVNLSWATTVPALALVFSPLTLLAGPIVAYNVAAVLMPALAAWTAFLLCRHLTGAVWPSLVGGYLFGFSSYVLAHEAGGHLNLSSIFLLPLVALVVLRFLDGELGRRGLVVRLGLLLALQLLLSTEVALTLTLAAATALLLGALLVPARRRRIAALLPGLAGAYLLAGVLTAPFVYYLLSGLRRTAYYPADNFIADLLNFVAPTNVTLFSGRLGARISSSFPADFTEQGAYLGLPVLLIVGLFAWRRVRTPAGRFLVACLAVGVVAALGAYATVDGRRIVTLPWAAVHRLPVLDNVLTARFTVYTSLIAAVIVALWIGARRAGPARWLVPALAVLAVVPDPRAVVWTTGYRVPALFASSAYRACLVRGANILPVPISKGDAMLWQVESGFRFDLVGGNLGPYVPPSYLTPPRVAYSITRSHPLSAGEAGLLRTFIAARHVTTVVVDPRQPDVWSAALRRLAKPQRVGGVVLYRFAPAPPSCPAG